MGAILILNWYQAGLGCNTSDDISIDTRVRSIYQSNTGINSGAGVTQHPPMHQSNGTSCGFRRLIEALFFKTSPLPDCPLFLPALTNLFFFFLFLLLFLLIFIYLFIYLFLFFLLFILAFFSLAPLPFFLFFLVVFSYCFCLFLSLHFFTSFSLLFFFQTTRPNSHEKVHSKWWSSGESFEELLRN